MWPAVQEHLTLLLSVTRMSGACIINNPWVWSSHNKLHKKMTHWNIIKHEAQKTGLGVMISRCSLDTRHWDLNGIQWMLLVLLPGTQTILLPSTQTMNKSSTQTRDHSVENGKGKIRKVALYCYFRRDPAKRGFRKRMIYIWTEFAWFKKNNQSPAVSGALIIFLKSCEFWVRTITMG